MTFDAKENLEGSKKMKTTIKAILNSIKGRDLNENETLLTPEEKEIIENRKIKTSNKNLDFPKNRKKNFK